MRKRFAMITPQVCALLMGALITFGAAAPAKAGSCAGDCGPAPCCKVLWYSWCGCPFDDAHYEEYVSIDPELDTTLACASDAQATTGEPADSLLMSPMEPVESTAQCIL